jgi:hypothetical protein
VLLTKVNYTYSVDQSSAMASSSSSAVYPLF